MKVITIYEENHGFIGTATTMKAAFRFLIEHGWLTLKFNFYDEAAGAWCTLRSVFEAKCIEPTKENVVAWAVEKYADNPMFWDGAFYFSTDTVCEREGWE
jgi:hypothetical protein